MRLSRGSHSLYAFLLSWYPISFSFKARGANFERLDLKYARMHLPNQHASVLQAAFYHAIVRTAKPGFHLRVLVACSLGTLP